MYLPVINHSQRETFDRLHSKSERTKLIKPVLNLLLFGHFYNGSCRLERDRGTLLFEKAKEGAKEERNKEK